MENRLKVVSITFSSSSVIGVIRPWSGGVSATLWSVNSESKYCKREVSLIEKKDRKRNVSKFPWGFEPRMFVLCVLFRDSAHLGLLFLSPILIYLGVQQSVYNRLERWRYSFFLQSLPVNCLAMQSKVIIGWIGNSNLESTES